MKCQVHQSDMVLKPAGVSKTTGREYPAFWSCPIREANGAYCRYKPPQEETRRSEARFEAALSESSALERDEKKGESINRAVALKASVDYCVGMKVEGGSTTVLALAKTFVDFLSGKTL